MPKGSRGKNGLFKKRVQTKSLATKQYVKSMFKNQQEMKYLDWVESDAVDFSGLVESISDIQQGDTDTSRDGDKCMPKSIELTIKFEVADTNNVCRFVIFRWHPSTGADPPAPTDILAATGSAFSPLSPFVHDDRGRFTVIRDYQVPLDSYHPFKVIRTKIKMAQKPIQFEAAGTSGLDKIYALRITDSGAATHPSITYYTRINYTDS